MSDPRLHSLHLEGQPRRETFRAAREVLQAACGPNDLLPHDDPRFHAPTPANRASSFIFYLKDGAHVYALHIGMNSVGRLPDNDVVIRDEHISRRHCAIVIHPDLRCELHDVASKNGTILNGKKIPEPAKLQSGDRITLCGRQFTFHVAALAATELPCDPSTTG